MEISNFYTATVYEKGAEVVRMIHTLLGPEGFRRGMDLYFQRFDGQAVTTDDFVQAMQDATGVDLSQFRRWYDQAGTPVLDVSAEYCAADRRYTLTVRQSCPPTPGQPDKQPLHIPLAVGLIGPDGQELDLVLADDDAVAPSKTRVLPVKQSEERFIFTNVAAQPVPSLLRGFSAPVILRFPYAEDELTQLLAHDTDPFNRWEAGQRLAVNLLLRGIGEYQAGRTLQFPDSFAAAFARVLAQAAADPAFTADALTLPSEGYLSEQMQVIDPDAIHTVRVALRRYLAQALREQWLQTYRTYETRGPYSPDAAAAGRRALRNLCLGYLMELDSEESRALAMQQFDSADNMTDAMAALSVLANSDCPERGRALDRFYARWKDEALVVDKWFSVQATSRSPDTLATVKRLMEHPAFELRNPNRVRALVSSFCHANQVRFHAADGSGYDFLAEQVSMLDPLNPQVAARLARALDRWRKFDGARQTQARQALERVRDTSGLSRDTFEVVSRALS
jgi:aminopeptidase N